MAMPFIWCTGEGWYWADDEMHGNGEPEHQPEGPFITREACEADAADVFAGCSISWQEYPPHDPPS